MAAIAHSPHSRRSKRRKLSRTSLGWVTLGRFPGFVCSCCKNHRSCPLLGATPNPLAPGVGIPMGHKASRTPLQEPTHRTCSLLLVNPPRKTLKPQRIWIRLQLEALNCFLQSIVADLCSRFGTRQPSLSYNPHQPPHAFQTLNRPVCIEPRRTIQVGCPTPHTPLPLSLPLV